MNGSSWLILLAFATSGEQGPIKNNGDAVSNMTSSSDPVVTIEDDRPPSEANVEATDDTLVAPPFETFPLATETAFERVIVSANSEAVTIAEESERLIYSNTLGINAVSTGTDLWIADDITTTAPDGCILSRFRFKVLGRVNPAGTGGAYTVRYALFTICPQSVSSEFRARDVGDPLGGIRIPGTSGELTFPDDAPRLVEIGVAEPNVVPLPTNFWLGISFSRSNCGTVIGAPAMVGHSADVFDVGGGLPCIGSAGGFPEQPHASIWAEVYGRANCPDSFVAYRAAKASGTQINPASGRFFADDIRLDVSDCQLIAYEVAVRNQGFYQFELRRDCTGPAIPGTQRNFSVNLSTRPQLQLARFTFDPPIDLNRRDLFIAFKVNNLAAGVVMAGVQPSIGTTSENYFTIADDGTCSVVPPPQGSPITGAFHVSITCAGAQSSGACCDPYLTECVGGPDAGKRCQCNAVCVGGSNSGVCCSPSSPCAEPGICEPVCAAPGSCEAVCREVPRVNCPGDIPFSDDDIDPRSVQQWVGELNCDENPFPHACGVSSCCHATIDAVTQHLNDQCTNLTKNECEAIEPLSRPRWWQQGLYCDESPQACPFNACVAREGSCTIRHSQPGCREPFCCQKVCQFDDWCCHVEWDDLCIRWSDTFCTNPPDNDACSPGPNLVLPTLSDGTSSIFTNLRATQQSSDPRFCCHEGVGTCFGGVRGGELCLLPVDCPAGKCERLGPAPGAVGYGTVWFKFGATDTSARISTCGSADVDPRATDSLLEVFAVGNPSSNSSSCNSLIPIACNDYAGEACPDDSGNSQLCITGLVPGDTYYVMLASKTPAHQGRYRLELSTPCLSETAVANDYCHGAVALTDGITTTTQSATPDCPTEPCAPDMFNDVWFDYTAGCTGEATIRTVLPDHEVNLVIYSGCECFPEPGETLACAHGVADANGDGPAATLHVTRGECLKLRIGDSLGAPVSTTLTVQCVPDDCQPNGIFDDLEIDAGTAEDCNQNGVPDECDLRDGALSDANGNGKPDQCERCPSGPVALVSPPGRVVDARRPSAPGDPLSLQGIETIEARAFPGANDFCWSLCETNLNPALHPAYPAELVENAIVEVVESPPGFYLLRLKRPITPGETTTLTYRDDFGTASFSRFSSHPGNVNGDSDSVPADILDMIDVLNGVAQPRWGLYSTDCDHSGKVAPADILCVIDLLNAGWNGTRLLSIGGPCP